MDWATIKPALKTLLSTLSGVALGQTVWRDQKRPPANTTPKAQLILKVTPIGTLGVDEILYTYDVPTDKNVPTQSGNRIFVLQIRAETFSHKDTESATFYLEEIQDQLKLPRVLQAFSDVNISLAKAEAIVDLSESLQVNSRVFSMANLDLRFNAAMNRVDPLDDGDYISSTEIEGTVDTLTRVDVTNTTVP